MAFVFLAIALLTGGCSPENKGEYAEEADVFLNNMPAGLQDEQCEAIEHALVGESSALEAIRDSRNSETRVSDKVICENISDNLRLYVPEQRKGKKLPILLYLHGGGWTFGSINSCARFCGELAATGNVIVLAVNYRLAPENPYPCGLIDCVEAFKYAQFHAKEWGSSSDLVSIGGDSSGGNLAIVTVLSLMKMGDAVPNSLVLFYPVVSAWNDESDSWKKYSKNTALDGELMEAFNRAYCEGVYKIGQENPRKNPFISPSLANDEDLARFPKILFMAAERDILYDQGLQFSTHLTLLGVEVERRVLEGSVHLFITVPGQEKAFREAVRSAEEFLSICDK